MRMPAAPCYISRKVKSTSNVHNIENYDKIKKCGQRGLAIRPQRHPKGKRVQLLDLGTEREAFNTGQGNLGLSIRVRRQELGLTQQQVAERAGLSVRTQPRHAVAFVPGADRTRA